MSTADILHTFAGIARPIMRQFMPANSCIAAARVTIETLRLFQIEAVESPAMFAFQVPAKRYARLGGIDAQTRADAKAKSKTWRELSGGPGGGWDGHLLVIAENRWILDPSIDQCSSEQFDIAVESEVIVIDSADVGGIRLDMNFEAKIQFRLESGDEGTLQYQSIDNRGYLDTEAWNDQALPILARMIMGKMIQAGAKT